MWRRFCVLFTAPRSSALIGSVKVLSRQIAATASPVMDVEETLRPLRALVKEQGDLVTSLKKKNAPAEDVTRCVFELKARKKALEEKELELSPSLSENFDRLKLDDLLKRRFFYIQSFEIYGGVSGLYDYGPMGCAVKARVLDAWRRHFVIEEGMLEMSCSVLTPEAVLTASGHVERFTDFMVKDVKTGECFRADHLIKAFAEKKLADKKAAEAEKADLAKMVTLLDDMTKADMDVAIQKYSMRSPVTGNELSEAVAFNLMFPTSIGPTGQVKGFLRPETAQGMFVNFKRLLEFNYGKLPFGAAQIGNGFRNEISPRQGIIRVREFTMAEIEYFVDPQNKTHAKFGNVRDYEVLLFSACDQMSGVSARPSTIGAAVDAGVIANESLGYFMARTHQFMVKVGVDARRLRFRQHLSNEMAHYATDCWDAECLTSYGWIECVGHADRACFDLQQHSKATGVRLAAERPLATPKTVAVVECVPNRAVIGKQLKAHAKSLIAQLQSLSADECCQLEKDLADKGSSQVGAFTVTAELASVRRYEKQLHVEELVPSVIEPAFGIGRIMYAAFEHNFRSRADDAARQYIALPPLVAPVNCAVLPLSGNKEFVPVLERICEALVAEHVSHKVDDGAGSIGRRYARTDEIGIPFGITVDFDSLVAPPSATLRNRDDMQQVRVPLDQLAAVVRDLCRDELAWLHVLDRYPRFEQQQSKS